MLSVLESCCLWFYCEILIVYDSRLPGFDSWLYVLFEFGHHHTHPPAASICDENVK